MSKKTTKKPILIKESRIFSPEFRKQKVKEFEKGLVSVSNISKLYDVSTSAVYKWIYKYSIHHNQKLRQVIEMKSENQKNIELLNRIKELERVVGQKQLNLDYLEKLIETANKKLTIDIKKNFNMK